MAPLDAYLFCSLAIFSSFVSADSSTINLFNPGVGLEPLYASVVGSDATATTYEMKCVPTLPSSVCVLPTTPFPFVEGPKTVSWVMAKGTGVYSGLTATCTKEGTTRAVCVSFGDFVFGGSSTYTQSSLETGDIFGLTPVTVTAGLKLLGSGTPSSSSASAAASATSTTGTPTVSTGMSTTGSSTASGSQVTAATASSAGAASSKASSGPAMPKATMNNGVLAAAAMAVALL